MDALHIVFDGFPSPDGPRFIEVETPDGKSVNAGEWRSRSDGMTELVIPRVIVWQPRSTITADQTVLVTVRRRSDHLTIGTFPAYVDEHLRICDAGSWKPDSGLDGPVYVTTEWARLPAPANPPSGASQ